MEKNILDTIPKETLDEILQKNETKKFVFNLNSKIMNIQYESFQFGRTQSEFEKFQEKISQYSQQEFALYVKDYFEKNY